MEGAFVKTLGTDSLQRAQALRDKYVLPLLAESSAAGMFSAVARCPAVNQEATEGGLSELRAQLPNGRPELSIKAAVSAFLDYLGRGGAHPLG
jgi:hypothetical protein